MRDMAGGSFRRALHMTFIPEFLSMNCLMTGMLPIMTTMMANIAGSEDPRRPSFWFVMSMALLAGGVIAYPINWWLVVNHLKHGMMTVRRPEIAAANGKAEAEQETMAGAHAIKPSTAAIAGMAILSIAVFAAGLVASVLLPSHG